MFSGASLTTTLNVLRHAGIRCFSDRTYSSIQYGYLVPVIRSVWDFKQTVLIDEIKENDSGKVKLGEDARCCSPGHSKIWIVQRDELEEQHCFRYTACTGMHLCKGCLQNQCVFQNKLIDLENKHLKFVPHELFKNMRKPIVVLHSQVLAYCNKNVLFLSSHEHHLACVVNVFKTLL